MKKGDVRCILVEGKKIRASFLGRGRFTTAWHDEDAGSVIAFSDDPAKEAIALFTHTKIHVPQIERIEQDATSERYIYRMPLYERLTARHGEAWTTYRRCAKVLVECRMEHLSRTRVGGWSAATAIDYAQEAINRLEGDESIPRSITEALQDILDAGSNYGSSMTFEFAPRNLAVDSEGNLIFLDILFDAELLQRIW